MAVGDAGVGSLLLADTATSVQRFVSVFFGVYVLLIFAYIIASWVPGGASPTLERMRQFLYDVCEPYLRLFRRVIPPIGPLDLSPIAAILSLYILRMLVNALIDRVL
jgi:YggT family protein